MANQNVVDELVVRLRLDTAEYDKRDAVIDKRVDATERKEKKQDTERERRAKKRKKQTAEEKREEQDRIKRMKETQAAAKQLGGTMRSLALTIGTVLGVSGGAAGLVGAVLSLANFETGLRRAAVSTGMSNREMQAWGSTAKRLGADADAGAQAIAELAREQKQFNLTGNGPTMMALARLGVRVSPNASIGDMLGQAQQIYRGANPAQQQQMEAALSAQGVSNDLIVMIKSEQDAREAYTRSIAESTEENKKALSALNDALASTQSAALEFANVIASAATPYVQQFANWLHNMASDQDGANKAVNQVADAMKFLYDAVSVIVYGFKELGAGVAWLLDKLPHVSVGGKTQGIGSLFADAIKWAWRETVNEAQGKIAPGTGMLGGQRAILAPGATATRPNSAAGGKPGMREVVQFAVAQGLSVPQAIGLATNLQAESSLNPAAVSPDGGARGLAQWRGDRLTAFRRSHGGASPDQTDWQTQILFALHDPVERARLSGALTGANDAASAAYGIAKRYEVTSTVPAALEKESRRRADAAQQFAASYRAGGGAPAPITITGPVTVQANDPQEFVGGIQRLPGVQNYNGAVR